MKKIATYQIVILIFIFVGWHNSLRPAEPDSIIRYKSSLENATGNDRLRILKSLSQFYADTLSDLANIYALQYLDLAEKKSSLMGQANAYEIMASIQKYQVNFRLSLEYSLKSLRLYRKAGNMKKIAAKYFNISDFYTFLHRYDSAIIYIDSGYQYFKDKNHPYQIFRAKLQMGKALCAHDKNEDAVESFKAALEIAKSRKTNDNIAWMLYWLGFTETKLGNFSKAEKYLLKSIKIYDSVKKVVGRIGSQQALGELYLKTGDYAKAYNLFFKAYQEQEYVKGERGSKNNLIRYYLNMGEIYFNIWNLEKSLRYYDTAMEMASTLKLKTKIAQTNKLMGRVYFKQGNFNHAEDHYQKALDYFSTTNSRYTIADIKNKIAEVYEQRNQFDDAISIYREALAINRDIGNKFGLAQNHINLASCYKKTNDFYAMENELSLGLPYAEKINVDYLLLRYFRYYIVFAEQTGMHDKAHQYFNQYIPLSQQSNEKSNRNLSRLLVELHTNELQKEEQIYDQKLRLTKLEAERADLLKNQMLIIAALSFFVVLLIAYFLINRIRMTKKLERKVNERTAELKENEKKLIEISQTKDQLYSIIAHDLKSPFNSLIGFANLLHDDYDDFSEKDRKHFVEIVRNSSEEIFALLENLLDWTRKSSQNMKFKPIRLDLQRLVKQTVQLQEKNADMKQIEIENNIPKNTFLLADENMLRTVIRNLTSNAIKFTKKNGKITFDISRNNGFVACSVSDNGIGMSQKTIEKLFDLSKNVKKKGTANEKGTGLGLLLCKDFVERNGGKLTVESHENQGSKFTFSLPAK